MRWTLGFRYADAGNGIFVGLVITAFGVLGE